MAVLHVSLLTSVGDASQFPFSRELLMQHLELFNELLTDRSKDIAGSDGTICLDSNEKLRNIGMSNFIPSHVDIGVHLEVLGEKVTQSVVFFHEDKIGGIGHS